MSTASHVQRGPVTAPARSAKELLDQWVARGRVPIPLKSGHILDALIVELDAPARAGGVEVDALVSAQAMKSSPVKRFAVVIGPDRPRSLSLPVLWVQDLERVGEWV